MLKKIKLKSKNAEVLIEAQSKNKKITIKEVPIRNNLSVPLSISKSSYGFGSIKKAVTSFNLVVPEANCDKIKRIPQNNYEVQLTTDT